MGKYIYGFRLLICPLVYLMKSAGFECHYLSGLGDPQIRPCFLSLIISIHGIQAAVELKPFPCLVLIYSKINGANQNRVNTSLKSIRNLWAWSMRLIWRHKFYSRWLKPNCSGRWKPPGIKTRPGKLALKRGGTASHISTMVTTGIITPEDPDQRQS